MDRSNFLRVPPGSATETPVYYAEAACPAVLTPLGTALSIVEGPKVSAEAG